MKRESRTFAAAAVAALCLIAPIVGMAQEKNRSEVALKAAIEKEMVDGDLRGAIAEYEKIMATRGASRRVAATALLHIAQCHEKLGQAQARQAYEKLVTEYADQSELAAMGRSRLAALTRPAAGARGLTIRRIHEGEGVDWCNGISSDGRYLSYPNWQTGDLGLVDLASGSLRRVTNDGRINQPHGAFAECSVFSPDDRRIAYLWFNDDVPELRTVRVDGSDIRVLHHAAGRSYLQPLDWSPNGKEILAAVWSKGAPKEIISVAVGDRSVRLLKTGDVRAPAAIFSPDGRWIVHSGSAEPGKSDISVMKADGSGETALVEHPADDVALGWSADGRSIFFASDRGGSYGVWRIDVDGGHPAGAPAAVKTDLGAMTRVRLVNGTLYYSVATRMSDVYTASFDADGGRLEAAPAPARKFFAGSNSAPDWSPDGKRLAYRSVRGPASALAPPPLISILDVEMDQERQVRPALRSLDFNDGPHWAPDGRSLLVIGLQQTPEAGVHRVNVETGATTSLVKALPGQYLLHALWSADGKSVIYAQGNPLRILRRDIDSGTDQELARLTSPAGSPRIALSPDGEQLAFTARERAAAPRMTLHVVPAAGGEPREVLRADEGEIIGQPTWARDGKSIFVATSRPTGEGKRSKRNFWRVRPDGSPPVPVDLQIDTSSFSLSPDGRRIAFEVGTWKNELWALENLGGN